MLCRRPLRKRTGAPARRADTGTHTCVKCAVVFAQRVFSVFLLALGAAAEFGAVQSSVKALETRTTELGTRVTEGNAALETRVTELGTRVTEGNAALGTRITDTNSRLAALDASVNTLAVGIQGVHSALLQLAAARAQPERTPPHAAAARLPQDDAQQ